MADEIVYVTVTEDVINVVEVDGFTPDPTVVDVHVGQLFDGFTFIQEATPVASSLGQTWYQPSTVLSHVWDGTSWVVVGSDLSSVTKHCLFSLVNPLTLLNSTTTAIPWTYRADRSNGLMYDTNNPSRLIASTTGLYHVSASVRSNYTATAGGVFAIWFEVNGDSKRLSTVETTQIGGIAETHNISTVIYLEAGSYVEVRMWQNSGTSMTIDGNNIITHITNAAFTLLNSPSGGGGGGGSDGFTFMQDTQPTATVSGQTWYDTSIGQSFVWYDGFWVQSSPGGGAGNGIGDGVIGHVSRTSGDTDGISGTWVRLNNMEVVVNLKAGRTYKISTRCRFEMEVSGSNGLGNLALSLGTTYDSANGLAFWRGALGSTAGGSTRILTVEHVFIPTTDLTNQLITVWAALDNSPAGLFSHRPRSDVQASFLMVEDITNDGTGPGGLTVTPWTNVTYQNSWFGAYSGIAPGQYRKVGDMVHLRGRLAGGAPASVAFTLPVGFRPPRDNGLYPCSAWTGSAAQPAFLAISPAGLVYPYFGAGVTDIGFELQFSVTP